MQCPENCNGHGTCINGMFCQCDEKFTGQTCRDAQSLPDMLHDDFESRYLSNYFLIIKLLHILMIIFFV